VGILDRFKKAAGAKADAALDRAIDPAKQLDLMIADLEAGRQKALAELVSYKASAKSLQQELDKLAERVALAEQRAMRAVRAGDDALAKQCLKDKQDAEAELARVTRDRDEMAGHAIALNRSRKELETKLQLLKLRKGTLATQLATARGKKDALTDDALFAKLAAAEEQIEAEGHLAEVDAELAGDAGGAPALASAELEQKLLAAEASVGPGQAGDDALAALKAKMQAGRKP
jgi:phage shock protein A